MSAKLRITDVERIVVDVPFKPRCKPWNDLRYGQWRVAEIIRLTTDAGLVGYGETMLHYTWGRVPDEAIQRVDGGNPADFLGDDSLGAGLQMALYDVVGKSLGVPVYRLFNMPPVREWCPIAWWSTKMPPEVLAEEAKDALAQGYIAHKFKARPWFDVYEQVEAVSAVTPVHYSLDLDWNEMLLNVGNAAPVLSELEKYEQVSIFESPIFHRDVEGYSQLRRKVKHPIAMHFGEPPFPTVVRQEVCDGFVLNRGVESVLQQGILAGAFGKPFWLQFVGTGLTTAMLLQLGAVLPLAQWPAVSCLNIYADDLLIEPLTLKGGYMKVPDAPGLGVEVDEDALTRYKMQPPYEISLPRQLLSVSWPGGRIVHYADMREGCWPDFRAGNQPVQERGARLELHPDDGSREWAELYARAQAAPVRDQR